MQFVQPAIGEKAQTVGKWLSPRQKNYVMKKYLTFLSHFILTYWKWIKLVSFFSLSGSKGKNRATAPPSCPTSRKRNGTDIQLRWIHDTYMYNSTTQRCKLQKCHVNTSIQIKEKNNYTNKLKHLKIKIDINHKIKYMYQSGLMIIWK